MILQIILRKKKETRLFLELIVRGPSGGMSASPSLSVTNASSSSPRPHHHATSSPRSTRDNNRWRGRPSSSAAAHDAVVSRNAQQQQHQQRLLGTSGTLIATTRSKGDATDIPIRRPSSTGVAVAAADGECSYLPFSSTLESTAASAAAATAQNNTSPLSAARALAEGDGGAERFVKGAHDQSADTIRRRRSPSPPSAAGAHQMPTATMTTRLFTFRVPSPNAPLDSYSAPRQSRPSTVVRQQQQRAVGLGVGMPSSVSSVKWRVLSEGGGMGAPPASSFPVLPPPTADTDTAAPPPMNTSHHHPRQTVMTGHTARRVDVSLFEKRHLQQPSAGGGGAAPPSPRGGGPYRATPAPTPATFRTPQAYAALFPGAMLAPSPRNRRGGVGARSSSSRGAAHSGAGVGSPIMPLSPSKLGVQRPASAAAAVGISPRAAPQRPSIASAASAVHKHSAVGGGRASGAGAVITDGGVGSGSGGVLLIPDPEAHIHYRLTAATVVAAASPHPPSSLAVGPTPPPIMNDSSFGSSAATTPSRPARPMSSSSAAVGGGQRTPVAARGAATPSSLPLSPQRPATARASELTHISTAPTTPMARPFSARVIPPSPTPSAYAAYDAAHQQQQQLASVHAVPVTVVTFGTRLSEGLVATGVDSSCYNSHHRTAANASLVSAGGASSHSHSGGGGGVVYHYQHDGSVVAVNTSVVDLSHHYAAEEGEGGGGGGGGGGAASSTSHHIVPVAAYRRPR